MTKCNGEGCPIRDQCSRYTQPYVKRNRFEQCPFDFVQNRCEHFHSNEPREDVIRLTAYYIWLREGKPANQAREHWERAYRTLCLGTGKLKPDSE
ncbi:MAG: DUF2934 domain-containing protein [Blastocatellia bacterium]|nr:DUF2934 domain-containing protein [Blastocatellia bacterium]